MSAPLRLPLRQIACCVEANLYCRRQQQGKDANSRFRFGRLLLHDTVKVGKDGVSWQELECYLFAEMLICVKERPNQRAAANGTGPPRTRCVLKGSIMIKKHLSQIETSSGMSSIPLHTSCEVNPNPPPCRSKHSLDFEPHRPRTPNLPPALQHPATA